MKGYAVLLTAGAKGDLEQIYDYVFETAGPAAADRLLGRIIEAAEKLATNPDRGFRPRELLELGVHDYRQLVVRPYRLFYRVTDRRVYVTVIAHLRRDMQTLLTRRLLGG